MPEVIAVITDPSNSAQLAAWDGDQGAYWTANADQFDRAIAAYHDGFLAAADIGTADRVLDVGCGTGQTTLHAARAAGSGSALGVDLSSLMIAYARRRAVQQGIGNARFECPAFCRAGINGLRDFDQRCCRSLERRQSTRSSAFPIRCPVPTGSH